MPVLYQFLTDMDIINVVMNCYLFDWILCTLEDPAPVVSFYIVLYILIAGQIETSYLYLLSNDYL